MAPPPSDSGEVALAGSVASGGEAPPHSPARVMNLGPSCRLLSAVAGLLLVITGADEWSVRSGAASS